jgi:hypothetical protein
MYEDNAHIFSYNVQEAMDNYWTAHIILGQFYVGGDQGK